MQLDVPLLPIVLLPMVLEFDHSCPEVDTDREVMLRTEALVCELHEEARFAHGGIPDDDVFEEEGVGHIPCQSFLSLIIIINLIINANHFY